MRGIYEPAGGRGAGRLRLRNRKRDQLPRPLRFEPRTAQQHRRGTGRAARRVRHTGAPLLGVGRGAVSPHARSGEGAGRIRRPARAAGDGLRRYRHDPLRRCRGRPAEGIGRADPATGTAAPVGGAHPPYRHQQPQPRRSAAGRGNRTDRRADVLAQPLLRPAAAERRRGHALGRRKLCAGAAQHRPRTPAALRILRTRRRGDRRDEGVRRRGPAERDQLAVREADDTGAVHRIRPDAPRRGGRDGRMPQPDRNRGGARMVYGDSRPARLHAGADRTRPVLVGRTLHVLRPLRPLHGGDRHRKREQILQPDAGAGRSARNRARTLQPAGAPRFGVHRLRPLPEQLSLRSRYRRPHAAAAAKFGY